MPETQTVEHLSAIAGLDGETKKIVPFFASHIANMDLFYRDFRRILGRPDFKRHLIRLSQTGPSVTMVVEDQAVGIMGLVPKWRGVGEVWVVVSRHVKRSALSFHRASQGLLNRYAALMEIRRVQGTVDKQNPRAISWSTRMGFVPEGTLHGYGPDGNDWIMVAKRMGDEP